MIRERAFGRVHLDSNAEGAQEVAVCAEDQAIDEQHPASLS